MRIFHGLLLVTLTMFLGGIVAAQQAPAGAAPEPLPAPCPAPVPAAMKAAAAGKPALTGYAPRAKVKDVMNSIVVPSSTVIFGSVATVTDASGVHEYKPQTDDDWNKVFQNAVMLAEGANLLMVPGRQRCLGGAIPAANRAEWNVMARELVEAGTEALVAAQKHDPDGISNAGERIDVACDECHERYQIVEDDPEGNKGKVLGTYKPPAPKP